MRKIILASNSPRRKELLEKVGLSFEIKTADFDECFDTALPPEEFAKSLALGKALKVSKIKYDAVIIAADTIVVVDDQILGKPKSSEDAKNMLKKISGRSHTAITGLAVVDSKSGKSITTSSKIILHFRDMTDKEIDLYVKTGEPLDKAGSYAVQGLGAIFIEKMEGDYYAAVGLPLNSLYEILKEFEIDLLQA